MKALYRRGLDLQKLNFLVEARDDFERALKIDPSNKEVSRELHSVVDCLALKPNGKRVAYHFDPLGKDRKGKKPLLTVVADTKLEPLAEVGEASCSRVQSLNDERNFDNNTCSRIPDVIMDSDSNSNAETYPLSPGQCDCNPSVTKSTKYRFSNKNQTHKILHFSSNDYDNLLLGRNLQFYHSKPGAYMKVRPISTKTSTLTGTPHEKSSWKAVVLSFSPLPVKLSPTTEFGHADHLESSFDEAVNCHDVKRPPQFPKESPSEEVDSHIAKKTRLSSDSSPASEVSLVQFHFIAVKEDLSVKCYRKVQHSIRSGRIVRSATMSRKRSQVSINNLPFVGRYNEKPNVNDVL